MKEDLISELIIISSLRKGLGQGKGGWFFINRDAKVVLKEKVDKFNKTFGKFPQTKVSITQKIKDKEGKFGPRRWDVVKDNFPDFFDIYVDDDWNYKIKKTLEELSDKKDKIYLLPDYKKCREAQGNNVLRAKITVSQIKDIDFALGSLEYRTKKLAQGIQELKPNHQEIKPNPPIPVWLMTFSIISWILAWLVWRLVWKKRHRK